MRRLRGIEFAQLLKPSIEPFDWKRFTTPFMPALRLGPFASTCTTGSALSKLDALAHPSRAPLPIHPCTIRFSLDILAPYSHHHPTIAGRSSIGDHWRSQLRGALEGSIACFLAIQCPKTLPTQYSKPLPSSTPAISANQYDPDESCRSANAHSCRPIRASKCFLSSIGAQNGC